MALTLEELEVIISAKTDGLEKAINSANKRIDTLTLKGTSSGNALSKAFTAIKASVAIATITKLTVACTKLGMEAQETVGMFTSVFGQSSEEMEEWIENVNATLGVSIVQLQRETAYIYSMAYAMGLGENNSKTLAKSIAGLSEDLSHFYNVSSEEAYNKLQSALVGQTRGLKEWGIVLDDSTIKQIAYSKGIAKAGEELTEQQKVLARYEAILIQTGAAQGSAVRELSGLTSQVTMLKNNFTQLGTTIGSVLVGPLAKALSYANSVIKAVNIVISEIFGIEAVANTAGSGVMSITDGLDDANESAKKLKRQLSGFDELNVISSKSDEESASVSAGFGGFEATEYDLGISGEVEERAESIANKIRNIINIVSTLYDQYVKPIVDFVEEHSDVILSILVGIGTTVLAWQGYFAALNLIPVITGVIDKVKLLWGIVAANPVVAIISVIAGVIAALVTLYNTNEDFRNFVDDTWKKITTWISNAVTAIKNKFNEIKEGISNLVSNVKQKITDVKNSIATFVSNVGEKISSIKSTVSNIINNIKSTVSGMFNTIKTNVSNFFENVKTTVSNKVKSIINTYLINPINKVISWINSKAHFSYSGLNILGKQVIPSFDVQLFRLNSIPQLAKGGIVDDPTLAMIGEQGKEAIVPLENNNDWINKVADSIGDNSEVEDLLRELITVVRNKPTGITKKDIGRSAVEYINQTNRLVGGSVV